MSIRLLEIGALALMCILPAPAFAATDVLTNGSFESGLSSWTVATQLASGATGTCGYNGATAPGTETITGVTGFPATNGTGIALGSVASTSETENIITCVLYQDVMIPAGATTATFTFDIGTKAGVDGGANAAARVGIYPTSAVPSFNAGPIGGSVTYFVAVDDAALHSETSAANFNVSALAGTTVRFAILNGANELGHEVLGIDNVHFLVTVPPPPASSQTTALAPSLSEWSLIGLGVLLAFTGFGVLRRQAS